MVDCAKLFGARRFSDNKGISQPCQVRFIHYFEAFYKGIIISPSVKILKKISLFGVPSHPNPFGSAGCRPFFNIY